MAQTEDKELVEALLAKRVEISAVIPKQIELADMEKTLRACREGMGVLDRRSRSLKLVLGFSMFFAQKNPSIWTGKYESFEQFAEKNVYRLGFERAIAFNYKKITEKWGAKPIHRISKIPTRNMLLISQVTDQTRTSSDKYLEAAETMTYKALQEFVEKKGHSRDTTTTIHHKITGTLGEIRDIKRFLADKAVHQVTGTDRESANIIAAISEFIGTHPEAGAESFVTFTGTNAEAAELQKLLGEVQEPMQAILKALGGKAGK